MGGGRERESRDGQVKWRAHEEKLYVLPGRRRRRRREEENIKRYGVSVAVAAVITWQWRLPVAAGWGDGDETGGAAAAKTSERRLTIFLKGCGNSQIRNTRTSAVCIRFNHCRYYITSRRRRE